jgi:hypothetical protein
MAGSPLNSYLEYLSSWIKINGMVARLQAANGIKKKVPVYWRFKEAKNPGDAVCSHNMYIHLPG